MKLPVRSLRLYSTFTPVLLTTNIRNRFLDYYIREHGHKPVNSQPIFSYFDQSVSFVDTGARQFKKVFIGEEHFIYDKVVNSQKCAKFGTLHISLNNCGVDPFHHTFFEMIGNWSFGSYGKKEACKLAWNLLTSEPFSIPTNKLFVSYFIGNEQLGLPEDEEVRELWLELGVPVDHIFPSDDSHIWQLDTSGPWGTSTKIHAIVSDKYGQTATELWNIGFINYNRTEDRVQKLPCEMISSGLGLERLVAILQDKNSSYHTDLFDPLFATIQKITDAPEYKGTFNEINLDLSYRRLVDFSRMLTVSIADGVFPDTNSKLKRMLRKTFAIVRSDFKQDHADHLLIELSNRVAETLHEVFPNVTDRLNQFKACIQYEEYCMQEIISHEAEWWSEAQKNYHVLRSLDLYEYPELPATFRNIVQALNSKRTATLSRKKVYALCEKCGIDEPIVDTMADTLNCKVDWTQYKAYLRYVQRQPVENTNKSPIVELLNRLDMKTDDSSKRKFLTKDDTVPAQYIFPDLESRLLMILKGNNVISIDAESDKLPDDLKDVSRAEVKMHTSEEIGFIFDRTNFFTHGGDSFFETGFIIIDGKCGFTINRIQKLQNCFIHYGKLLDASVNNMPIAAGAKYTLRLDAGCRLHNMRLFTLAHLIIIALKKMYPYAYIQRFLISQFSAGVKTNLFEKNIDLCAFAGKLENRIRELIEKDLILEENFFKSSFDLLKHEDVILHPALKYPYKNIRVVSFKDAVTSESYLKEPCDGVHLKRSSEIGDTRLLNVKKDNGLIITAVVGSVVDESRDLLKWFKDQMKPLEKSTKALMDDSLTLNEILDFNAIVNSVLFKVYKKYDSSPLAFTVDVCVHQQNLFNIRGIIQKNTALLPRETLVQYIKANVKSAKQNGFAVYFFSTYSDIFLKHSPVLDILYDNNFPSMVFWHYKGKIRGLSHVPRECLRVDFNAGIWMRTTLCNLPETYQVKKEEEEDVFCYLNGAQILPHHVNDYIEILITRGRNVAHELFQKKNDGVSQNM